MIGFYKIVWPNPTNHKMADSVNHDVINKSDQSIHERNIGFYMLMFNFNYIPLPQVNIKMEIK